MKQYIEFALGTENYVIEMSYVREIVKLVHITKLVGAPEFVKGVSKVRDDVVTIIDLHQKFNIDSVASEAREPGIIILDYNSENVGLLVDEVVNILESDHIENMSSLVHLGIVREIIKVEDRILPLLDIERLFSNEVTQWLNSDVERVH
jgi:purine-binding chemotaxis protein CheW